ncbi:hypothetical protein FSP39_019200 [Pinctada imbricata]|uniref:ATP-dependent DNA helicase n=1 Tax=Pinctada imbricata TaxID=66713 RepID=A0AA88XT99_PINIB|nr:hypothetical protein FSP39_019200 [Pinctada imbricata]
MDEYQKKTFFPCLNGHNAVICGQAGTGKSYLLTKIVDELRGLGKSVSLTSSTGISATQLGGITIHKWAGIGNGRYLNEEILHLIRTDERYNSNLRTIRNTDVLAVDEISMISTKVFNQVEFLCRKLRCTDKVFGGIQVVLCGDFYQLSPAPNFAFKLTFLNMLFLISLSIKSYIGKQIKCL